MNAKTNAPLLVLLLSLAGIVACSPDQRPAGNVAANPEPAEEPRPPTENPAEPQWGHLSGRIVYDGEPPEPIMIPIKAEANLFGPTMEANDLIVSSDNRGIANVVVYLHLRSSESIDVHPEYAAKADNKVELISENGRYHPHILLLRTSQTLIFKNKDSTGHDPQAGLLSNPANFLLLGVSRFASEERTPRPIGCSIHPWMKSYLVLKHHPYMAKTDEDGRFEIRNLPVGEHTFQLWHEKAGYLKQACFGERIANEKGRLTIDIQPGENELGTAELQPAVFEADDQK